MVLQWTSYEVAIGMSVDDISFKPAVIIAFFHSHIRLASKKLAKVWI